jgi:hypothetical protein
VIAHVLLERGLGGGRGRFDLLIGGLMLGVYTILGVAEHGWGSTQTPALGAVSLVLLAAFIVRQSRIPTLGWGGCPPGE